MEGPALPPQVSGRRRGTLTLTVQRLTWMEWPAAAAPNVRVRR